MGDAGSVALVLVAHGTADERGQRVVLDLVGLVSERLPHVHVTDAYVDVQEPAVADVVAHLSPRFERVVAVPLLFCGGYHVRVDLAKAVAPHANAVAAPALGPSHHIARSLVDRLAEAGVTPADPVVLAAAGSSRSEATADAREQARLLAVAWGAPVDVAFGSAATPRVADAVAANRDRPGARVAIASLLLGEGHFSDLLRRSGADVVTRPLGASPDVVTCVIERYDAVVAGVG